LLAITGKFADSEYPFVRTSFVTRYGEPHQVQLMGMKGSYAEEQLDWNGKKRSIVVSSIRNTFSFIGPKREAGAAFSSLPPSDSWLHEPDGFGGVKLWTTRQEVEAKVRFSSCEPVRTGYPLQGAQGDVLQCKFVMPFEGVTLNAAIHSAVPAGTREADGRTIRIYAVFDPSYYPAVKAALMKMYGEPHRVELSSGEENLDWRGSRVEVHISYLRTAVLLDMGLSEFKVGGESVRQFESFGMAIQDE
jgi:hypothetical protein